MSFDKFAWLDALLTSDATDGARLVGARLALKHENNGRAWPSYQRLADDLNRSPRAVRRATEELRGLGYLEWTSGNGAGHSNRYRFLAPPKVVSSDHDKGGREVPPSDEKGGQQRHRRWSAASQKVDASGHRTNQEPSKNPPSNPEPGTKWPDGWSEDHPRRAEYQSVLERLARKLKGDWVIVKAEPAEHVQKLRNAAARAAEAEVDPWDLAEVVTRKPLEGAYSFAAVLAKRIDDALPSLTRAGAA